MDRRQHDKISNYWKSIVKTILFRHYLKQHEQAIPILTNDTKTGSANAKVTRQFNFWIKLSVIDVRNANITVMVSMPPTQQGQEILNKMLQQIQEYLSNSNSNYFISSPTRVGNSYWLIGQKR